MKEDKDNLDSKNNQEGKEMKEEIPENIENLVLYTKEENRERGAINDHR